MKINNAHQFTLSKVNKKLFDNFELLKHWIVCQSNAFPLAMNILGAFQSLPSLCLMQEKPIYNISIATFKGQTFYASNSQLLGLTSMGVLIKILTYHIIPTGIIYIILLI
jgi:hypothetical protein